MLPSQATGEPSFSMAIRIVVSQTSPSVPTLTENLPPSRCHGIVRGRHSHHHRLITKSPCRHKVFLGMAHNEIEMMSADVGAPECSDQSELEGLRDALRFTLTDGQRLLRRSDVEDICPSKELCFEYGNHVRCGPCAVKQAQKHGVESDISLPFSPSEYRLKRQVRAAETEIGMLNAALKSVVESYRTCGDQPDALKEAIGAVVEHYGELVDKEFAPALISVTAEGRLAYAGVEFIFAANAPEGVTLVRRVEEWAMNNLTMLPGGRWRIRET
jgi:hypothetical protein